MKALLKAVKERGYLDSLATSQEGIINTLLDQENILRKALNSKKVAFDGCAISLEAEGAKSIMYTDIIKQDKKTIRKLKMQRYIIGGFALGLGYLIGK